MKFIPTLAIIIHEIVSIITFIFFAITTSSFLTHFFEPFSSAGFESFIFTSIYILFYVIIYFIASQKREVNMYSYLLAFVLGLEVITYFKLA